ncbi:MAG: hypothetical protein KatS3mg010_2117 [Acidimicrobiia bacterium]|nr:MAG: hypothetical protein KatS3mg010_2117 [Acidimicrobiia bacterium]
MRDPIRPAMTGRLSLRPDGVDRHHAQVAARGARTLGPQTGREYGCASSRSKIPTVAREASAHPWSTEWS